MGNSANRISKFQERKADRIKKAESYTVNKPIDGKLRAKTHVKAANLVDFSITALGSKTLGALTGGAWGLARGVIAGIVVGGLVSTFLFGGGAVAVAIVAVSTVKGLRDGYYHAENNYSGKKGKEVGDRIAAEGNAQAPKVKSKVMNEALKQARAEVKPLDAAELQKLKQYDVSSTDRKFQDQLDNERLNTAQTSRNI